MGRSKIESYKGKMRIIEISWLVIFVNHVNLSHRIKRSKIPTLEIIRSKIPTLEIIRSKIPTHHI